MMTLQEHGNPEPELRSPRASDAAAIWQLVERMGGLELNSGYAYVLLCSHFAETGVIAEQRGQIVGFVLAYLPPTQPDAVFVWQVGVAPELRGQGLAARMLSALVRRPAAAPARYLTATVTPDNAASLALFRGFAARHDLPFNLGPCFPAALFPGSHADEDLIQIGPLRHAQGISAEAR